jgi:hypothetical protein
MAADSVFIGRRLLSIASAGRYTPLGTALRKWRR